MNDTNTLFAKKQLDAAFLQSVAVQVVVSDITYLETDEGVQYLSLVTDAYSRRIMGHDVSSTMTATDIGRALRQATKNRMNGCPLIHH